MAKKNKKSVKSPIFIVFVLFLFFLLIGFVYYNSNKPKKDRELYVKYKTNKTINITNKLPISDKLGKDIDEITDIKSYVDFVIENPTNNSLEYDIYITKTNKTNSISDSYIKLYLTNGKDNPIVGYDKNIIPLYKDLRYLLNKPASKLIYSDYIAAKSSKHYKLRVWLSDSYAINDNLEYFKADVDVRVK